MSGCQRGAAQAPRLFTAAWDGTSVTVEGDPERVSVLLAEGDDGMIVMLDPVDVARLYRGLGDWLLERAGV